MSKSKHGETEDTLQARDDHSPSDEENKFEITEHKESKQLLSDPDDGLSEAERKRIVYFPPFVANTLGLTQFRNESFSSNST